MNKDELLFLQIKENVLQHLKGVSLVKKDRNFLLELIKLFDVLAKNPNEEFINLLITLINSASLDDTEELNVRLLSLNAQLEHSKFTEIRHLSYFSVYFQKERVNVYIKKISFNWDLLISEIAEIKFTQIRVIVYKSSSKKEKVLNKVLNKNKDWKSGLIDILENNICINIHVILDLEKESLY